MSNGIDTSQTATPNAEGVSEDAVVNEAAITTSEKNDEKEVYELGFHLLSHLDADAVAGAVTDVRKLIEDRNGRILSEGYPELLDLAYPIEVKKPSGKEVYAQAHFGWMVFEVSVAEIAAITEGASHDANVLRSLVVKADPNYTFVPQPKTARKGFAENTEESTDVEESKVEKPAQPISEEELDRSIDELVEEK